MELLQFGVGGRAEPVGLFADDFGGSFAEKGLAEESFGSGGFVGEEERGESAEGEEGKELAAIYCHGHRF